MQQMPPGEDIQLTGGYVTLAFRRCPDGSAVVAMAPLLDGPAYAMIVTPQNVMAVIDFLVNRPAAGAPS